MNEATWIIIAGLVLDIFGALLIVGPLRHRKYALKRLNEFLMDLYGEWDKRNKGKTEEPTLQSNKEKIEKLKKSDTDRQIEELEGIKKLGWGIALLILGFILQIIGNLFQNPPL